MPPIRRLAPVLVLAALPCLAVTAAADEVHLSNGRKLEGKARRVGDEVVVQLAAGEVRLPAKDVLSITTAPTKDDLYRERVAKLDSKDAAQQMALADWCRDQSLAAHERKHLEAVIGLDPDHEAARARLGFIRSDGAWLTQDEYHAARGFVKVGKEWVSKEELAQRQREKSAKAAMEAHLETIRGSMTKMSSPLRKVRLEGKVALQRYAEKIGDPKLADFAGTVARWYNDQWRQVKAEWEGAEATVTVRATKAELKRPIPVIETSLGAFSTPVRIQLPELSVVRVQTTARLPVTIELDE